LNTLKNIIFPLLLVCSLSIFIPQSAFSGESEIVALMDNLESKLNWLNYRVSLEYWDLYTKGSADSLEFYQELYNHTVNNQELLDEMKKEASSVNGKENERRYLLLIKELSGSIDSDNEISKLTDSLSQLSINYRAKLNGEEQKSSYLYEQYLTNSNRSKREDAYRAWVSKGLVMSDGLHRLIKMRNAKSKVKVKKNYFKYTFDLKNLNLGEYLSLLERLDTASRKPYKAILSKIAKKLGVKKVEIWDLAYAYNNINKQIDYYFPVDSQMVYVKRSLKDMGIDIDKLPIFFDLDSREGKSEFAYAFTIKAPYDMRVLANLTPGILSTKTLFHEIGHALHSAYISQGREYFRTGIDGIWAEGMGQTMAFLMYQDEWMEKYTSVPKSIRDKYLGSLKEKDIIYLRKRLMRLNFEYQAYTNPDRDLNELYWELFEEYMMLPPHDNIKPWASVIHFTTHPVYIENYLYADMIAAQTLEYLKAKNKTLFDGQLTKSFLIQNYFRFGNRYDWRELLERGTESSLSPDHYLKQLSLDN